MVGEHPDRLELLVVEQVGLVDHDDGGAAAFGVFGGQGVGGLRGQGGGVEARDLPEGGRRCGAACRGPRRTGWAGR